MFRLVVVLMLLLTVSQVNARSKAVKFEFTDVDPSKTFIVKIRDPAMIKLARDILAGKEQYRTHIRGNIVKKPKHYNPDWSYHLRPNSIDFFEFAVEVCDSTMQYVEDNLKDVGGALLPGGHWCPWQSRLVRALR